MMSNWLSVFTLSRILNAGLWCVVASCVWLRLLVAPLEHPLPISSANERLLVEKGTGFLQLSYDFQARAWISNARFLTLYGRILGFANHLKAGEYSLEPGTTLKQLLEKIRKGDVVVYQVTFVEGMGFRDFLRTLKNTQGVTETLATYDAESLAKALGMNDSSPEGWFFPDTYFYEKGETDVSILKRAYQRMQQVLEKEWQLRVEALPYVSAYEALIMASIIEKETAVEAERGIIAGVFVRRLQKGMRLQTDPTVIYGLGDEYDGNITRQHLISPNPYNTYLNAGLPPTPIANPGEASIRAALNPEPGDAIYFVATGEGKHQFSATLEEHERAVDEYQRKRRVDYRSSPLR